MFGSVTFFTLAPLDTTDDDFEQSLRSKALKTLGPLEMTAKGFISPFGKDSKSFIHSIGDCLLFTVGGFDKVLPAAAVNAVVESKLDAVEASTGQRPKGKAKSRIKDDTLHELMPKALVKPNRCYAYIDRSRGFLAVATGSRAAAESVVSVIRAAIGSFPALPLACDSTPSSIYTAWLKNGSLPEGFALGNECEIKEPVEGGAIARLQRYELPSVEVEKHISAGMKCSKIALSHQDSASFVLDDTLTLRKVKFDMSKAETLDDPASNPAAELDAEFAIVSSEIGMIFDKLSEELSFRKFE